MYDLFMDFAIEEFSHLEIVGSMITMLLDGLNDDLKQANERCDWMPVVATADGREQAIHQGAVNPIYLSLTGGGQLGGSGVASSVDDRAPPAALSP